MKKKYFSSQDLPWTTMHVHLPLKPNIETGGGEGKERNGTELCGHLPNRIGDDCRMRIIQRDPIDLCHAEPC